MASASSRAVRRRNSARRGSNSGFSIKPSGVAVDQPLDGAARLGQLTVEGIEFEPMRRGLHRVQAPLILRDHPCRVVEQPADLAPDRLIELINRNQPGICTGTLAVEAAAVRAATAIVPPVVRTGDTR